MTEWFGFHFHIRRLTVGKLTDLQMKANEAKIR